MVDLDLPNFKIPNQNVLRLQFNPVHIMVSPSIPINSVVSSSPVLHGQTHLGTPKQPPRRKGRSTEEPNAFRIDRTQVPAEGHTGRPSVFLDVAATSTSPDTPVSLSPFARAPTESPTPLPPSDSTSWLPSTDLLSPTFNAHHFLQRVLSHSFDKTSRPARLPQLDEAFDADAALAALDTVESALRRRRDAALREELSARESLRSALHISAKRRDALVRTAHNVSKHVASSADVGRQASSQLTTALDALKTFSHCLAGYQDARDLLFLLTNQAPQLDSVRISKLLSSAKAIIQSGELNNLLATPDVNRARREVLRCERQLEATIFDSMKRAVDESDPHVISECAMAAEQLGTSHQFIEAYVKYVFSLDTSTQVHLPNLQESLPNMVLGPFRTACWEVSSIVRDSLSNVFESFSDPSRPLATLLQMVADKKVLVVADATLTALINSIRQTEQSMKSLKHSNINSTQVLVATRHSRQQAAIDRARNRTLTDSKETWRENVQRVSDERYQYLAVCVDIFTSLRKLMNDLFELCRSSGARDVEKVYSQFRDPYTDFYAKYLPQYLEVQKLWVDDRMGVAFFDITRIDTHAPRLAPRERSNADVYHRYRSFYEYVSSNFFQMTQKAIQCVHESLCQTVAVLNSIPLVTENDGSSNISSTDDLGNNHGISFLGVQGDDGDHAIVEPMTPGDSGDNERPRNSTVSYRNPKTLLEMRIVIRELLDSLVMNYVANAETLLQAATHLLPVCEEDAEMAQLWLSGASPLTAYIQAIEVITKSNELLDNFLLRLAIEEHVEGENSTSSVSEKHMEIFISHETRDALNSELTTCLSDLSSEAQVGVQAAISSLRARLFSLLATEEAMVVYTQSIGTQGSSDAITSGRWAKFDKFGQSGFDNDPSETFMSVLTFLEQQLQTVMGCVSGGNQEFILAEMSRVTREAVLNCWCNIDGTVTTVGASQMVTDGRAIIQVFQDRDIPVDTMECLPEVGQLFLERAEGLWGCIESRALGNVEAKVIVELLRKREDFDSECVDKVCQSLQEDSSMISSTEQRTMDG